MAWCISCLFTFSLLLPGEGNGTPLQYSCLENPMDGGAWKATVRGVTEGRTQLSNFTFTFHFHALRRKWQPTPVFLPGESQGLESLVDCCLWGCTELDTTEVTAAVAATASRYNSLLGDAELWCLSGFKAGPADIPFGTKLQVWKMLSLTRWTSLNAYN